MIDNFSCPEIIPPVCSFIAGEAVAAAVASLYSSIYLRLFAIGVGSIVWP